MTEQNSQWCLIANVLPGVTNATSRHFSAGTKVYCLPAAWGDGYEQIPVVGVHRGSRKLACVVVSREGIGNWRAKVVYSPAVLRMISEWCLQKGHPNWSGEQHVGEYLDLVADTAT